MKAAQLAIIDTHPIQYRSPVFRALTKKGSDFEVFFLNENFNSHRWWFHEKGKTHAQPFGVDLESGFPFTVLRTEERSFWRVCQLLFEVVRSHRVTLIYGYYLPEHWVVWLASLWYQRPLIFVGESFSAARRGFLGHLLGYMRKIFFSRVALFLAIGKKNHAYYLKQGIAPSQVWPVNYCVGNSFFQMTSSDKESLREEGRRQNRLTADDFVFLFVGRLFERKRPLDVIDMASRLKDLPHVHFLMVGNGPLEDEVAGRAEALPNCRFVGFKDQNEMRQMYAMADALWVPSTYETWGLVVNEAFATGIPALVTQECGVADELVVSGKTGEVYPAGDLVSAESICRRWANNASEVRCLGAEASARLGDYSPERFAEVIFSAQQDLRKTSTRWGLRERSGAPSGVAQGLFEP